MGYLSQVELEARRRWAAQNILESEALTADLADEDAGRLLAWGVAQAERLALSSAEMDPAAAHEAMDARLIALRRLMRGLNKMVADQRPVDPARLQERMGRLLETAAELGLAPAGAGPGVDLQAWRNLPAGERLGQLLALLAGWANEQAAG